MKTTTRLMAFALLTVVASSVGPPPTTAQPGCLHEGTWHPEGSSFQNRDNPCNSPCVCRDGRVHCAIVDCFTPRCVDAEYLSGQCCQVCPNGPNCGFHGEVIPAGERKQIGPYLCVCPAANSPDFSRRNNPVRCFPLRREPPVPK